MSDEEFKLLLEEILFRIPRDIGMDWIESFLANFDPIQDAPDVEMFLRHHKPLYKKIYEKIKEAPERQVGLFNTLFDDKRIDLHGIFFSFEKLLRNLDLVENIFPGSVAPGESKSEVKPTVYHGEIFAQLKRFEFENVYKKNPNLAMAMIRFIVKEQMSMMKNTVWFNLFLRSATTEHVCEVFQLLLEHHEMTPEIIEKFMDNKRHAKVFNLLDKYIPPELNLPRGELLMRCALLSLRQFDVPPELGISPTFAERCRSFSPEDNMDELRDIAISSGDRQSLSILFYLKSTHQRDTVSTSEMLEYVLKGKLSPSVTCDFIVYAIEKGMNLDGWPLKHLPLEKQPRETRLLMWQRGGGVSYSEPNYVIDFNKEPHRSLRGRVPGYLPIRLKLTEPIKTSDGRLITRAADAFIFNAKAVLDKYRSGDKVRKTISKPDYRGIIFGVLYALAEGQCLDFSNTEAEMLEGSCKWTWFDVHLSLCGDSYGHIIGWSTDYLGSAEIYNYVHKASSNDEQVEGIIDDIAALSINSSEKKV
jgi:hypothetical protein